MLSKLLPPINRIIHPKIIRQFSTNSFILKQKDIKDQFEENLNLNSKSIKKPNLFPGNSNSNLDIKSQVKSHINDDLKTIKKKNIQIPKEIKILYDLKESNNSISNSSESIDSNIESNSKLNILKEQIPTESTDIKAIFTEINQNETTNPSKPIINNQQSKPIKEPSTPLHDIITSPPSYSAPKKEISPHVSNILSPKTSITIIN